jgi:penicillin-binding protein A
MLKNKLYVTLNRIYNIIRIVIEKGEKMKYNSKYISYKSNRVIKDMLEKRYNILTLIIIFLFSFLILKLYILQLANRELYKSQIAKVNEKVIEGSSSPRGRIYDRNYNLLVDNVAIKTIIYKKPKGVSVEEELLLAKDVAKMINIDFSRLTDNNLKRYWIINNEEKATSKIKEKEWQLLRERKLTNKDIERLKLERVSEEELSKYTDLDKESAYIYYLMNNGYYYDEKIIKNDSVSDLEYALISENINNLKGFNTKLAWNRVYLYGDVFRSILGNISNEEQGIPYELKDYYLARGYSLNDRVGISYLEYQYEDILKGIKPKYKLLNNNQYKLLSEGKRGNDIVLTIDIKLQQELENILSQEVLAAKSEPNTEYFNKAMAVVADPKTGDILAMAGKQVLNKDGQYKVFDYTPGITTSPVIVGSVVKGASMMLGYKKNIIKIGDVQLDECLKIKNTPPKCSWKTMGNVDDIEALAQSSNVYQFKIAIKIGGGNYQYNKPLVINKEAFNIYRNFYKEFGLGVKTGIDLPIESLGYKGNSTMAGHILDFSIGQYDTYTPIQLSQYINTIANSGYRIEPHLLKEVYAPSDGTNLDKLLYQKTPTVLNKVNIEDKYIERVRTGFVAVMNSLGNGYMGSAPRPAGKTGTSQSFFDSDNDGMIDKETTTKTFVGYAPYDNPKMSIIVVSPDVSHNYNNSNYITGVNKRIAYRVSNKFFDFYQ